jgi:CubicO group peptidase (beta-lactamase class C family)
MPDDFASLDAFVPDVMREAKTPGLSISIVSENRIVYARGFGFRDISSGLVATPRTLYGIGSVTKSFTALAIMQLADEGRIALDDPVEKYVPAVPKSLGESPTVHHLLSHSSGLPALGYAEAFMSGGSGSDQFSLPLNTPEDVIAFMKDAEDWAVSKPGMRFFYLNEGYVLLGYIISKVVGKSYEEYVRERILLPLGMTRTYFSKADVEREEDRATPYIIDREGKHIPSSFPYGVNADGGLVSNVIDLSNYVRMCIDHGALDGKALVSKKMFEAMEQPHIVMSYEQDFGTEFYGYGWGITPDFYGSTLVGHAGSVGVHEAYVGYIPEKRIGVAFQANPSNYPLEQIGMYALAALLGIDPDSLPFVRRGRILRELQGEYETYKGTVKISVRKKGDFLFAEFKDKHTEETLPLVPVKLQEDYASFYTLQEGAKMTTEFHVKGGNVEWIFDRYKAIKKRSAPVAVS